MQEFKIELNQNFFANDYVSSVEKIKRLDKVPGVKLAANDVAIRADIRVLGEEKEYVAQPLFIIKDNLVGRIPDEISDLGLRFSLINVHPETDQFSIGVNTRQKNWVVLKAMEKPLINVLWSGTLILMAGFGIAIKRRYSEFKKMREKGLE